MSGAPLKLVFVRHTLYPLQLRLMPGAHHIELFCNGLIGVPGNAGDVFHHAAV